MAEATVVLPGNAAPAGGDGTGTGTVTPPPAAAAPVFSIPDAYKEKPYLKGVDSPDKLFAMLDGAQELIGKRPAGIPAPDASPEDWNKFYDALGRPKTAAEYTFDIPKDVKVDEKVVLGLKEMMHKNGLTPMQAKGMQKDFDAFAVQLAKDQKIVLQQQDTDFTKLATDTFGADRDKILARGKELIDTFAPPSMKGEVAKLSNENLIVLAGVLNNIANKYIKADAAPGTGPVIGTETPDTLRTKARALMAEQAAISPIDLRYAELQKQIDGIYRQIGGLE